MPALTSGKIWFLWQNSTHSSVDLIPAIILPEIDLLTTNGRAGRTQQWPPQPETTGGFGATYDRWEEGINKHAAGV